MSEPVKRATSLQDIGAATVGIKIKRPDGQVVEVALRSATEGELWEIRRSLPKVSPPVKDMTKSGPVYDYQDPGFVAAVEDNNRLFAQRVLLASLVDLAVPGETDAERIDLLRRSIGQYAYTLLIEASQRLNLVSPEEVAAVAQSFRPL